MRRYTKPTILILCLTALVAVAATETNIDYMQVAEDIDIMARIIDKTLEGKFPDEYKVSSIWYVGYSGFRGCQGIYLKGYGAVFMTSVGFPVAEQTEVSQEKATPDDLWQQTKYGLKGGLLERGSFGGGPFGGFSFPFAVRDVGGNYNSEKVKQLKEELVRLIGTYASNIRQLSSQENVVIAVRGTPELQVRVQAFDSRKSDEKIVTKVTAISDKGARDSTTLIVKVNKESIMAYKDDRLDFASLMKQAEITQY